MYTQQNRIGGGLAHQINQQGGSRTLGQNTYLLNQAPPLPFGYSQQSMNSQNQTQSFQNIQQQTQQSFWSYQNGIKTCKWHKGQAYIAVCSWEGCRMGRLCCLRCMVQKHTDHTQHLILLDELRDSDVASLSVPMNWTSTLGAGLRDDIAGMIGLCRHADIPAVQRGHSDEISKIDDVFDTLTKELVEDLERLRAHAKSIANRSSEGVTDKLIALTESLRKALSPSSLLEIVDQFIMQGSTKNEALVSACKTAKNIPILHQQAEQELEENLNTFFTSPRVSQEESEAIYKNYQFLGKSEHLPQGEQTSQAGSNYLNLQALNDVREQVLNVMHCKERFSEIFFPDTVLHNKLDNLEKVRSLTTVYDEITVPSGVITSVEAIDNERFLVIRDNEVMEVWNIDGHKKEYSYCLAGAKSLITPVKMKSRLLVAFISNNGTSSVQVADTHSRKIIRSVWIGGTVKQLRVLSARDETGAITEEIILAALLETGEVKVINVHKNTVSDLRNKNTSFLEVLPETRCYSLAAGEDQTQQIPGNPGAGAQPSGIVTSYALLTASNDLISVWYPLAARCVRNIKVVLRPNESVKQIGAFETSTFERQVTYFADSVAGCPSRQAVALLTNKSLRIFNWFKANCLREIPVEDCNSFHILPTFVQGERKNIFLLYNVGENKPAEYTTCDWSAQKVEYWNSGSLANFSCVRTLNQTKILELGKQAVKNSDSKKPTTVTYEIRARIKSLN